MSERIRGKLGDAMVEAALNDTIDHLENVVAEWRGDRTT